MAERIEHISEQDFLNDGRVKINKFAIDPALRAEQNSNNALNIASDSKEIANNTDNRLDNIVAGEMQDGEVIDARRPFGGEAYPTLGERLDSDKAEVTAQLQQTVEDVKTVKMNKAEKIYTDTQLNLKRDKDVKITNADLDTTSDTVKIKLINLSEEVQQTMAGTAPVIASVENGTLVKEKFPPKVVSPFLTNFLTEGKNLFNKNTALKGYRIQGGGNITIDPTSYISDYIPVLPSTSYARVFPLGTNFYDNSYNFIGYAGTTTFTTPANAQFIRISVYDPSIEQLEKGTVSTSYEPYKLHGDILTTPDDESVTIPKLGADTKELVINLGAGKYENLFKYQNPIDSPSIENTTEQNTAIRRVAKPNNFNSNADKITEVSINTTTSGYWWVKVDEFERPKGKISVSMELMLKAGSVDTTQRPFIMVYFFDSADNVINFVNTRMDSALTTTSRRVKVENLTIPNNTDYIRVGVNVLDIVERYEYFVSDIYIANNDKLLDGYVLPNERILDKEEKEAIAPSKVYVVANEIADFGKARQYSSALYLDHMFKNIDDKDIVFEDFTHGEGDKYYFYNNSDYPASENYILKINNGVDVDVSNKVVKVKSDKYAIPEKTVKQISTKASLSKNKFPRVLFIGDSITFGSGANPSYGNGELPYWAYIKKLFELDRIDGGNNESEYNFMSLGVRSSYEIPVDYKGVSRTSVQSADGMGGWALSNFLHHNNLIRPSQATWDSLGLGDGTGTDFTGSIEQCDLIFSTNENDTLTSPYTNPYFDNDKAGDIKFSIAKWLERYRTCDDNGNKLTLDSPNLGTLITTQEQIDKYNVCTPTHVIMAHGRNDLAFASVDKYIESVERFITAIKTELPNAIIGICTIPDNPGTFFPERYPQIIGDIRMWENRNTYDAVKRQLEVLDNRENENLYLLPTYFIQPTAWGTMLQEISMPESFLGVDGWQQDQFRRYRPLGEGIISHPGSQAHIALGYQIYAWLKYVLAK